MTRQLRVHRVSKSIDPELLGQIRSFMESVFSSKNQTLITRHTDTHVLFYLRMENERRPTRPILRKEVVLERPQPHRWMRS